MSTDSEPRASQIPRLPDIQWPRPLQRRWGSPDRLARILVFHDFDWLEHFPDERTQFKNGKCLAEFVQRHCPSGKVPALLLTDETDADEGAQETDHHYVFVVNLGRYRATASNAALSYLGSRVGAQIARPRRLREVAQTVSSAELSELIRSRMDVEDVEAWIEGSSERLDLVRSIVDRTGTGDSTGLEDLSEWLAALTSLNQLDARAIEAITALLGHTADAAHRVDLLRAMTDDSLGRELATKVLGERTAQRMADALSAVRDFDALLSNATTTETVMQRFIEERPWLLGLDYAAIQARTPIMRGTLDFWLLRFDGFADVLELKSPNDSIVVNRPPSGASVLPSSPSQVALSQSLAQALAQVHTYRSLLSRNAVAHEESYGLPDAREPRLIIVIGQTRLLTDEGTRVLEELNRSLHRVEVVPYDVVGKRAKATLGNVRALLGLVSGESD